MNTMNENIIDSALVDLDWRSLYRLAEFHDKQAIVFRSRANKLQQRENIKERSRLKVEFLHSLPKYVLKYLKQGHTIDIAIDLTTKTTDVPEVTVRSHWKNFVRSKSQETMILRNSTMLDMHFLGFTNVEISKRLDLHPVTVSRVLKKMKKRRIYHPNKDKNRRFIDHASNNVTTLPFHATARQAGQ